MRNHVTRSKGRGGEDTDLASSVDDIAIVLFALCFDSFCKGVFDGGMVVFNEMVFSELNDERRLSWKEVREIER